MITRGRERSCAARRPPYLARRHTSDRNESPDSRRRALRGIRRREVSGGSCGSTLIAAESRVGSIAPEKYRVPTFGSGRACRGLADVSLHVRARARALMQYSERLSTLGFARPRLAVLTRDSVSSRLGSAAGENRRKVRKERQRGMARARGDAGRERARPGK